MLYFTFNVSKQLKITEIDAHTIMTIMVRTLKKVMTT